ncbi:hypothetical protein G3M48_002469 [Beauveria asiatica]|uniref:LysM domain-containing protein n=1 Tax=Beauveria asiatica TaxID=1069075 RepID=A0AAW0RX78_9HYPO
MGFKSAYLRATALPLAAILLSSAGVVAHPPRGQTVEARDGVPGLPFHTGTTPYCSFWYDNDGSMTCEDVIIAFGLSMDQFGKWNPSVTSDCENFLKGHSYCMETKDEPIMSTTTTSSPVSDATTTTITTPTKPDNGIETPSPMQPGMVSNCNKFYWVETGQHCDMIAAKEGISVSDFLTWNPKAGAKCSGLWAETYACVSVIGYTRPTRAVPDNGVQTPSPTQPGMVANCNKFRFVYEGDSCVDVAAKAGISVSDLVRWNPQVGSKCSGLWANTYACVGVMPSFRVKTRWSADCGGAVHDEVALEGGDGICVQTGCAVSALDIASEGYCPDGDIRVSYWGGSSCDGAWYGFGYGSRGQCRTLWSGGWKFKSLYLRCAKQDDDCITQNTCTYDPEPAYNLC